MFCVAAALLPCFQRESGSHNDRTGKPRENRRDMWRLLAPVLPGLAQHLGALVLPCAPEQPRRRRHRLAARGRGAQRLAAAALWGRVAIRAVPRARGRSALADHRAEAPAAHSRYRCDASGWDVLAPESGQRERERERARERARERERGRAGKERGGCRTRKAAAGRVSGLDRRPYMDLSTRGKGRLVVANNLKDEDHLPCHCRVTTSSPTGQWC